jgi:hypothetical protein
MGCPPRASIERTDRKLVFMGPVSLVAGCQQMLGFAPTASLVDSGEKLSTNPQIGQPVCYGVCQEQWPWSTLLTTTRKVAICGPCEIRMICYHTRTEHEKCVAYWSGFPLQGVHRFKSPRFSDMSNRLFVTVSM